MREIADFFVRNSFYLELILAYVPFVLALKRRSFFVLRCVFSISLGLCLSNFIPSYIIIDSIILRYSYGMGWFAFIFVITLPILYFCFDIDIWTTLFCGVGGYAVQHIFHRLNSIPDYYIRHYTVGKLWVSAIIFIVLMFMVYGLTFLATKRLRTDKDYKVNNKQLVLVMLLLLGVTVIISYMGYFYTFYTKRFLDTPLNFVTAMYSCLIGILTINSLISNASNKKIENEAKILETLWKNSRKQYEISKQSIELLNIKYHDLKYQIQAVVKDKDALLEVYQCLDAYGSILRTKNETLDVVLAEKSYQCKKENIQIACIVDGELLQDMHAVDIYSLFGNAIDNAIECLSLVKDSDKKFLNVTVKKLGSMVNIIFENYFPSENLGNTINIETTKADKNNHGYGLKSISYIVEKYSGNIRVSQANNLFVLNIILPL